MLPINTENSNRFYRYYKKLCHRNKRADWQGMKGLGIDGKWNTFWLWTVTSSITLTLHFQGQILKILYPWSGVASWHGTKKMWVKSKSVPLCDWILTSPMTLEFQWQIFKNPRLSGMGGFTDMDRKECESLGCWTHYETLSYNLDLVPSRSDWKITISQE